MNLEHPQFSRVMTQLRRALVDRRQVIDIGGYSYHFQRRGETFDSADGETVLQALQSGIFKLCPVESRGERLPGRWVHVGYSDDLEEILQDDLASMSDRQVEELSFTVTANAVLQEMAQERREQRARGASRTPHP